MTQRWVGGRRDEDSSGSITIGYVWIVNDGQKECWATDGQTGDDLSGLEKKGYRIGESGLRVA